MLLVCVCLLMGCSLVARGLVALGKAAALAAEMKDEWMGPIRQGVVNTAGQLANAYVETVRDYLRPLRYQPETKQLQLAPPQKKTDKPAPENVSADDGGTKLGVPRDVNMEKLNKMLKSGKLSDKEAEFYRKIE